MAQKYYREAATQGYARAAYNLALMLEEGRGSPADPAAAAELYRAAATQNYGPAQNNLGILLAEGRGVKANLVEAYAWLALAVENGAKPIGRDIVAQQLSAAQAEEAKNVVAGLRTQIATATAAPTQVAAAAPTTSPAPVAPAAAAPSTPAQPAVDMTAVNARLAALQSDVEKLRAENARLTATSRELVRTMSDVATVEQMYRMRVFSALHGQEVDF